MNLKFCMSVMALCILCLGPLEAKKIHRLSDTDTLKNNIPPRLQWDNNAGYCGEVSLISAGLYYGQYLSQYDARAIAIKNSPQNKGQLLLGKNDVYAASQMHLNVVEWDTESQQTPEEFISWVKGNVVKGYPVVIGIFTNEYRFYNDTDPDAGDDRYDHIVPVIGIGSNHSLTDPSYYGDDVILFSDNGLWGDAVNPPYLFSYGCDAFQADREEANRENGAIYSLYNGGSNYGIAVLGVMDENGDTLPVRIDTNVNYEEPVIADGSTVRPLPMPLNLTVTVSNLQPHVLYNLYKYDSLDKVPNAAFNAHASNACEIWQIQISSGSTYVVQEQVQSDTTAIYRAVKASSL